MFNNIFFTFHFLLFGLITSITFLAGTQFHSVLTGWGKVLYKYSKSISSESLQHIPPLKAVVIQQNACRREQRTLKCLIGKHILNCHDWGLPKCNLQVYWKEQLYLLTRKRFSAISTIKNSCHFNTLLAQFVHSYFPSLMTSYNKDNFCFEEIKSAWFPRLLPFQEEMKPRFQDEGILVYWGLFGQSDVGYPGLPWILGANFPSL